MTDKEKIRAEIERRYKECKGATPATEYQELLDFIDSMQEEYTTSVWHDAKELPEIHRKYLTRYADGKVNGSWERHDEGFIPWKEVVKEHKFTHWCYVENLLKL